LVNKVCTEFSFLRVAEIIIRPVWRHLMLLMLIAAGPATTGSRTLDTVRARHLLLCGISSGRPGFAMPNRAGVPQGMDPDTCRAVAAAALGDATRVKFVEVSAESRFAALQSAAIDLLLGSSTWTLGREANAGLMFAGITYYDGTAFLVKKTLAVMSAGQLDGATICLPSGTSNELAVADYFRLNAMSFKPLAIANPQQIQNAFLSGRCDAYAADRGHLTGFRALQAEHAGDFVLLPEVISKEPLGPIVRKGDDRWFDIVRWTLFAQVAAEEFGVTRGNVDRSLGSRNPAIRRLLGVEENPGTALGLDRTFGYRIIKQVGNYGDMWDADIAPLGEPRGLNNLWTKGGLHYAPPLR
jgi:general L-amino acid transport system substrate-binding protein